MIYYRNGSNRCEKSRKLLAVIDANCSVADQIAGASKNLVGAVGAVGSHPPRRSEGESVMKKDKLSRAVMNRHGGGGTTVSTKRRPKRLSR